MPDPVPMSWKSIATGLSPSNMRLSARQSPWHMVVGDIRFSSIHGTLPAHRPPISRTDSGTRCPACCSTAGQPCVHSIGRTALYVGFASGWKIPDIPSSLGLPHHIAWKSARVVRSVLASARLTPSSWFSGRMCPMSSITIVKSVLSPAMAWAKQRAVRKGASGAQSR